MVSFCWKVGDQFLQRTISWPQNWVATSPLSSRDFDSDRGMQKDQTKRFPKEWRNVIQKIIRNEPLTPNENVPRRDNHYQPFSFDDFP
jgi:hypothetical protein